MYLRHSSVLLERVFLSMLPLLNCPKSGKRIFTSVSVVVQYFSVCHSQVALQTAVRLAHFWSIFTTDCAKENYFDSAAAIWQRGKNESANFCTAQEHGWHLGCPWPRKRHLLANQEAQWWQHQGREGKSHGCAEGSTQLQHPVQLQVCKLCTMCSLGSFPSNRTSWDIS